MLTKKQSFYETVYKIVQQIPFGKVSTYGRIAMIAGSPRAARATGYALAGLKENSEKSIPWQRVVNAQGKISSSRDPLRATLQRKILEKEGVLFDQNEMIDLKRFGWP